MEKFHRQPVPPGEALKDVRTCGDMDQRRLEKLEKNGEPGTPLWHMHEGGGLGRPATSLGLVPNSIEQLFGAGGNSPDHWLVAIEHDDGETGQTLNVVPLDEARRAWWITNEAGELVAGGPPIYDEARARSIAERYQGIAQLGLGESDPGL